MILCLDVGNTHIFGGLYAEDNLQLSFRYPSSSPCTSDQLGVFFKSVLRENEWDPHKIRQISICSVVPSLNYSIRSAFLKYFSLDPQFLQVNTVADLNIDLTIGYKNPHEVGADRISCAIAAIHKYAGKDIIVIDLGTATTFDAITAEKVYLGGVIIPGVYISMKALYENTAKLSPVTIVKPEQIIGQTTTANIQSGLYYSHLGAAREIIERLTSTVFHHRNPVIIGTGGFAYLFENDKIFTAIIPELVLHGLNIVAKLVDTTL
jgi:type III pantothenate kinase